MDCFQALAAPGLQCSRAIDHGVDPEQQRAPVVRPQKAVQIDSLRLDRWKSTFEPCWVPYACTHFMAIQQQPREQTGADKAVRAEQQDSHVTSFEYDCRIALHLRRYRRPKRTASRPVQELALPAPTGYRSFPRLALSQGLPAS